MLNKAKALTSGSRLYISARIRSDARKLFDYPSSREGANTGQESQGTRCLPSSQLKSENLMRI